MSLGLIFGNIDKRLSENVKKISINDEKNQKTK